MSTPKQSKTDLIIEAFLEEKPRKLSGTHVSTDGHTLFSYTMPIARHAPNSTMLIIRYTSAPSSTTRQHVRDIESATRLTRPDLFISNVEAIDNDRRELFPNLGPGAKARMRSLREQKRPLQLAKGTREEIQFDPELEAMYREYKLLESTRARGTSTPSLAIALLGDAMYAQPCKMPKWSIQPTILEEPKAALRYFHTLGISTSKAANAQRAEFFQNLAQELKVEAEEVAQFAYETYGEKGPLISGVLQDHFPQNIKDRLRFLNQGYTKVRDAVRLHEFLSKTRSPQFH